MNEQLSPWGTPTEVAAPAPAISEVSPFHQEAIAEQLPEKERRSFGQRILEKMKLVRKPVSVVGDMSNSLHNVGKLGNYQPQGLDGLTDGGLEKTGQYDASREEVLGALQTEAQIEDDIRTNAIAQEKAEFFQLDSQKPALTQEHTELEAKMHDAEEITLTAAQSAELRRRS